MDFDANILITIVITLILIILLLNIFSSDKSKQKDSLRDSQEEIEDIKINNEILEEMIDIVTTYSMMRPKQNEKMVLIYLSTFHLFDMNYDYRSVEKLDKELENYPYIGNEYEYPKGNKYHNLQKAIITNITKSIVKTEFRLTGDTKSDRKIIGLYIKKLFTSIGIYEY